MLVGFPRLEDVEFPRLRHALALRSPNFDDVQVDDWSSLDTADSEETRKRRVMAHRQSFKPVRASNTNELSTSSKFRHDLGFLHDSKAGDPAAHEPTQRLNLDALKRSKQGHTSAHNSLDANYPAQKPFSRSSAAASNRTAAMPMPDHAVSNSSPANHFRGAPAFVLPSAHAFERARPASAQATSVSIHESLFTQSGPVIPAFQQRPASAAPPTTSASNTMHHDMPPPRAFSRAAQRPGSAAPLVAAHQNGFLSHGQQASQWRPSQSQQDEQMMDFSMEDGFDGGEGEGDGEMIGMGMGMDMMEDQENIPPSQDRGARYNYGGPASDREASAPISQSGSGIGVGGKRSGSAMADHDEEDDLYASENGGIGGIRAQKRMRFHDELDQQVCFTGLSQYTAHSS